MGAVKYTRGVSDKLTFNSMGLLIFCFQNPNMRTMVIGFPIIKKFNAYNATLQEL